MLERRAATAGDHEAKKPIAPDQPIIITLDGPAGTGKSSVAHALAHRLGLDVLDTGAMYRAAAAIAIDHRIPLDDLDRICDVVKDADLHFDWQTDPPAMLAWMKSINDRIRAEDVTALVSQVAAIPELRRHMVRKQRIIAQQHPRLVSEGRDQGSVVFPDAHVKFYLDADPAIRARRRAEQLRAAGHEVDEQALLRSIIERDRLDSSRQDGPLTCPDDAIVIDTSNLEFDQVVDLLAREALARLPLDRN